MSKRDRNDAGIPEIMELTKRIILAVALAAGLGGCANETLSHPELYVSFMADGALRELRVNGSQTVFYTTEHNSRLCIASDSTQAEYGCDYQLYSGSNLIQDIKIYFYISDLKNNLAQYNGVYYYADLGDVSSRLPVGQLNYLQAYCQPAASVGLYYYKDGTLYRNSLSANRDSSFFQLTRSEIIEHPTFGTSILLEGTFACKMYCTSGDSIFLSEGKFTGVIDNPD